MANQFTGTTFSGTYKDDYRDSDGYHKVLFNSGRALQGRELNQLQTILQKQVTRMADNIFMDGAAVSPKSSGASTDVADYIIVDSLNLSAGVTVESFIGTAFQTSPQSGTNGLQFQVSWAVDATTEDQATLYGRYISYNQAGVSNDVQASPLVALEGDTLTAIGGSGLPTLTVYTQPAESELLSVGLGVLFSLQSAEFYTQGHFVYVPKQTAVISKYEGLVDCEVGFEVVQDIVTVSDDVRLYDNQGSRPNLSAPGADRYRISMILNTRDTVAEETSFVTFATVRSSKIVQIKEGNQDYNMIEKRMAQRHSATHGNFIVNDFVVQFRNADSAEKILYNVPGAMFGTPPLAYLDGYYLEHTQFSSFSAPKPLTTTEKIDQGMQVGYKNYITFDAPTDAAGDTSLGSFTTTLNQQEKLSLLNSGGTVIGNTRLKSLVSRNTEDSDAYRMYLYDTKMIGSSNFRDVRKINSTGASTPGAVVGLEDSQLYIKDPSTSISLFEVPGGRVSSMLPTAITVQRFDTDTVAANLKIVVSSGANEDLVDKGEWIIINTTQDKVDRVPSGNIDIVNNTGTITTTGTAGDVCHVYYYVTKSAPAHRTKVYKTETFTATRTSSGDPAGDVFKFTNLYDGVELLEALDGTIDYLEEVIFDGGQRDNFYGPIQLTPDGIGAAVTTLTCKVGYFDHGTSGDYFSVNSYAIRSSNPTATLPLFDYGDIPTYISPISGEEYEMHDYIDFRPKLDPNATNMTATDRFDMPRDGDGIVYNVVFYNMRLDHIALTYGEDFKPVVVVNSGEEGLEPVPPTEYDKQMVLFDVLLPGNVKDQNDVRFNRRKYRGYKMSDVADLEERISNLEETVSLTALEAEASNLVEVTSGGAIRSKTGFFIEDFSQGYAFTATSVQNTFIDDESFATSSMNEDLHTLNSKFNVEHVGFEYERTNFLPASRRPFVNSNVVRKGELLMLQYLDVLDTSMKQEVISWRGPGNAYEEFGYYNVNPFNVFTGEGILALHPAVDNWSDTTRLPDKIVSASTIQKKVGATLYPHTVNYSRTKSKKYYGDWFVDPKSGRRKRAVLTLSSTQKYSQTQSVTTRKVGDSTVVTKREDRIVLSMDMPWMRQKRVFCQAKGLRSNHRYYMFFDGTPMSQWIKTRSKAEWLNDKAAGVQNEPLPSTNVNYTGHPTTSASAQKLVSDPNGELHFEMWIPNTSSISVPLSTRYSSENEWKSWYQAQKTAALTYGGKSAATYDAIGWKFAAKQTEVKLLDVSVDNDYAKPLSTARSFYDANGTRKVRQNRMHSTRTLTYSDAYYASSNPQTVGDPKPSLTGYYQYCDPLAQTFALAAANDVPGVFITKVDIFFRSAPEVGSQFENVAVQLQIRGTTSGVPERDSISNQHRVYKDASAVRSAMSGMNKNNLASVLARPVTFHFEEPIYIRNGEEYAIVLLSDCDEYEVYVASTYDEVLGSTTKRVSKQPATGSLFLSQNGSTWTPKQNQDMAYRIYTAKFKPAGAGNFYSWDAEKFLHNRNRSLTVDTLSNTRFRVNHANHGLGTGDSVGMENLPSGIYRGVADNVIQHAQNKVTDPDTQGYYVNLADPFGANSSATFTSKGGFGTSVIETNRGMSFSEATLDFADELFDTTKIVYKGSFVTGMSHAEVSNTGEAGGDPRFDIDNVDTPLGNQVTHFFDKPRYLGNDDQVLKELDPLGGNTASVVVGARLTSGQRSTFGGTLGNSARLLGYVSDVSPIIDTQNLSMLLIDNVIDNQVDSDSEVAYPGVRNKPADWISETASLSGSSPSKHITKTVQLGQGSGGVRVFIDAYVPPLASITLYYRTGVTSDEDLYNKSWTQMNSQNFPLKNTWVTNEGTQQYSEYKYLIGGEDGDLPSFVSFQLKVVMKTSNNCQAPILKSIRSIALT